MQVVDIFFWQENLPWIISGIAACVAIFAGYMDSRRQKREDFDNVGFMPWTTLTVLAGILSFSFLLYAIAGNG